MNSMVVVVLTGTFGSGLAPMPQHANFQTDETEESDCKVRSLFRSLTQSVYTQVCSLQSSSCMVLYVHRNHKAY